MITDTTIKKMDSMELACAQILVDHLEINDEALNDNWWGGDFRFESSMPYYIRIERVGGSGNRFGGTSTLDMEVFAEDYDTAESVAFAIEALLLGYPHVVEVEGRKVVIDEVFQNDGATGLPWEADNVTRLGATYVLTARRR